MSNESFLQLVTLFSDVENTQLMKQSVTLFGLKYIKIHELLLLHSFYHKTGSRSENTLFAAPTLLHKVEKKGELVELTIRALKDEHDQKAVSLVRALGADEIEVTYSHLAPNFLAPKIHKEGWDNWVFAYNLPFEERMKRRKQRTIDKATTLCKTLADHDFTGKKILFLACGDGDEVATFLKSFPLHDATVTGIDQSAVAVENCKKIRALQATTKLHFLRLDLADLHTLKDTQYDYILAMGLFDRETLSFTDGQRYLGMIREFLRFTHFITTGYSFELFCADDYYRMGFDLIASCEPETMYTYGANFFYSLQNSARVAEQIEDDVATQSRLFFEGTLLE